MAVAAPFILIAEDEPAHAELIRRAFETANVEAEFKVVQTLREYRDAIVARPPDLALVDVNLPDGRALDVLTCPPDAGPFPVVVMTSYGDERMAVEVMKAGALDYIPKSAEAFASMPRAVLRALDQWEQLLRSKWAEQELHESEERFRLLVEQCGNAVGYYGLDGTVLFFNRQALRYLGGRAEDYVGKSFGEVLGGPQAIDWMNRLRVVAASPDAQIFEDELSLPTGRKWFLSSYARMVNASGDVTGVQFVAQDITRRKQAEEDLRARQGELQAVHDNISVMTCLLDTDRRILFANRALAVFTRIPQNLLPGQWACGVLGCVHASGGPRGCGSAASCQGCPMIEAVDDTLKTGSPHRDVERQLTISRGGGVREIVLNVSSSMIHAANKPLLLLCLEDITERRLAQARQELAAEVLGVLNRPSDIEHAIGNIVQMIKSRLGFDAVAIRLCQGQDFTYYIQNGFSQEFVQKENSLCSRDAAGQPVLDAAGNPVLECMCGTVLMGSTDSGKPFFTSEGSFWTNSTTDLLASTCQKDRQGGTRNRCNREGYESVALIPLRSDDRIIGLLQVNDRRRGQFSIELIRFLEGIGSSIGIAIKRKQVAEALDESRDKFRRLHDSITDAFVIVDLNGDIRDSNRIYQDMLGYSAQELSRLTYQDLTPDRWHDMEEDIVRSQVLVQGSSGVYEKEYRRKDGTVFPIEMRTYLLRDSAGQPSGMWAIVRDITERKRAQAALAEETSRNRILFDHSPDGIVILDPQTMRFLEFNTAAHSQLGYSREEFARLSLVDVDAIETPDQTQARIAGVLRGGRADFETRHRTRQGSIRDVLVTAQITDIMGRSVHHCVWRDITEYKELEKKFLHAQKMEAIGLLAGGVAHDFRNQLTVIKGYGELLLRRDLIKDEARAYVEHILSAANRSATISSQLLAFSRQQTLRPEVISVDSVTGDMMKSLVQTLGEDIRLSVIPCQDLWSIRADAHQLQQALLNLVLNARDAMPRGGQLTIETENVAIDDDFVRHHAGASAGRFVLLTVSDAGTGMGPETLGHLFEPFFTTKLMGEGTGLGLAMVHGFVNQSGGFIEVQSQPDRGTAFRIYLPAVDGAAKPSQQDAQTVGLARGTGTLLVVEDEEGIRQVLLETLGECGYKVLSARNAQEAMALVASAGQRIDMLVTDVVMPGLSGPDLAKQFQAVRPGVPVLLISGHTGKMLAGHGVVPPDMNLLIKPFSSQTLAETIHKILQPTTGPGFDAQPEPQS